MKRVQIQEVPNNVDIFGAGMNSGSKRMDVLGFSSLSVLQYPTVVKPHIR